ncbi:beta-lactamase family protein [Streptomyces montanus]|uniref:Beta-lactamase family protein n=1 Tax=Streptomyces montanus TaxID=2580423 RepID=A0A5R9FK02_9ACTN|nr:serine hydrolase domain-containing protein [Streptomyces montanus]TLS41878.1 beta-lactamase family protein [Streptomyces montanus]
MPPTRTLLVIPVSVALLGLVPTASSAPTPPASDTALAQLVTRGRAPAAALMAREETGTHFAHMEAPLSADSTSTGTGTNGRTTDGPPNRTPNGTAADTPTPTTDGPQNRTTNRTPSRTAAGTETGRPADHPEPQPSTAIRAADHFRAGSITKTFIATLVLQLAAEHRLSLSDSVDAHLPGLVRGAGNDGRALTLRALLTHTSGIADFTTITKGAVSLTPLQAVRIALTRPPADRGRFAYSNTNYVLLGMVVEQVTGHSYAAEAERRIVTPLRLTGTSFPGSRRSLPDPHGRAYATNGSDVTELDPRVAGAAGELITTLTDLNRFYAALLRGDLLPPRQLREMLDTGTAHGSYGMGLYPVKLPCGTTVWGHDGRISGSYVRTAATRDGRRVVTFRVNTDEIADPRLEPALLAAEFCPLTS